MKKQNEVENVQGAELQQEKKRSVSKTYTLKQFGEIIEKLDILEWITGEQRETLEKIKSQAKNKFIEEL